MLILTLSISFSIFSKMFSQMCKSQKNVIRKKNQITPHQCIRGLGNKKKSCWATSDQPLNGFRLAISWDAQEFMLDSPTWGPGTGPHWRETLVISRVGTSTVTDHRGSICAHFLGDRLCLMFPKNYQLSKAKAQTRQSDHLSIFWLFLHWLLALGKIINCPCASFHSSTEKWQ